MLVIIGLDTRRTAPVSEPVRRVPESPPLLSLQERCSGWVEGVSRTATALRFFTAAMGLAVVERILRIAIVVAFWPAIAIFAPIDPERVTGSGPGPAGLVAAGGTLAVFLFIDAILVVIGLRALRAGRSELGPEHSTRIGQSQTAMIVYVVVAFLGNIGVAAASGTFLPWLGYTFSINPTRYAAFTLVNVVLAVLAGFAVFWIVERLLDRPSRAWAIRALALGVGSAVAVMVVGLTFLILTPPFLIPTPLPSQPTEIPFAFAMAEISGDVLGGVSIVLWLIVYRRTLDRIRRGELVTIPPGAAYSNARSYIPPTPPTPP